MGYRPEIEYLRAFAVLSVMVYHFFPELLPGGFIGVDVFFVISGFLISRILVEEIQSGRFRLLEFYRRRIRRIFPALTLVMGFLLASGWFLLFSDEYANLGKHLVTSALFLQNVQLYRESGYFDAAAETKPLLHLWSLSIEEQFYLFWPLLLTLGIKKRWGLHALTLSLLMLSLGFNALIRHTDPTGDFFGSAPRFWELLVGALALRQPKALRARLIGAASISRWMGVALLITGLLVIRPKMAFPGFWALLPTIGALLVILPMQGPDRSESGPLGSGLEAIGKISYPLYLWHWPLLSLGQILSGERLGLEVREGLFLSTFLLASLTYCWVEKPLRQDRTWRTPGVLIVLMCLILGSGIALIHEEGIPSRRIEHQNPSHSGNTIPGFSSAGSDCQTLGASVRLLPHCKIFNADAGPESLLLWGDSSAIAWTPVFLAIARERGARLIVIAHTSCPPLLSARKTHFDLPASAQYCQDGQTQWDALSLIKRQNPDLIIFMGALGGYRTEVNVSREDTEFMTDRPDHPADRSSNRETLLRRLPETLTRLAEVAPVLVFRNWPLLPAQLPPPSQRRIEDILHRETRTRYYARDYFDHQRELIDQIFDQLNHDRIGFFDPSKEVCDARYCSNQIDGVPAYSDRYHITPQGAMSFLDALREQVMQRLGPKTPSGSWH
jgi:peptidoglycan/LPS O-acetylase OafA/YrhL